MQPIYVRSVTVKTKLGFVWSVTFFFWPKTKTI